MGAPSLAALASLILLSPVASPQYVVWLLPFAAITAAHRRESDVRILMIGAGVFASAVFSVYWGFRDLFVLQVIAAGRALCLLGLVRRLASPKSDRGGIRRPLRAVGVGGRLTPSVGIGSRMYPLRRAAPAAGVPG